MAGPLHPAATQARGPAWSLLVGVASVAVGLTAGATLLFASGAPPSSGVPGLKLILLLCAAPALCLVNITAVASHDLLAGHRKSVWTGLLLSIVGACAAWAPLLLAD